MKIILKEDVHKLGQKGDVVEVKPGFARNYLMPQKLAILFTEQQQKSFEEANRVEERKLERQKDSLNSVLKELEKLDLSLKMKSEEGDKLFGSVTKIDIAKLLDENGITIDKKYIILSSPIKTLGESLMTSSASSENYFIQGIAGEFDSGFAFFPEGRYVDPSTLNDIIGEHNHFPCNTTGKTEVWTNNPALKARTQWECINYVSQDDLRVLGCNSLFEFLVSEDGEYYSFWVLLGNHIV